MSEINDYIVKFYDSFVEGDDKCIVTELCLGDLKSKSYYSEKDIIKLLSQMSHCLKNMHNS